MILPLIFLSPASAIVFEEGSENSIFAVLCLYGLWNKFLYVLFENGFRVGVFFGCLLNLASRAFQSHERTFRCMLGTRKSTLT